MNSREHLGIQCHYYLGALIVGNGKNNDDIMTQIVQRKNNIHFFVEIKQYLFKAITEDMELLRGELKRIDISVDSKYIQVLTFPMVLNNEFDLTYQQ